MFYILHIFVLNVIMDDHLVHVILTIYGNTRPHYIYIFIKGSARHGCRRL